MKTIRPYTVVAILAGLWVNNCGNSPTSPTQIPKLDPIPIVNIPFQVFQGHSGGPVSGADISVTYLTETKTQQTKNGETVFEKPPSESEISILANNYLELKTLYHDESVFRRFLWPLEPLEPDITSDFIYTLLHKDFFPNDALSRLPLGSNVCLIPSTGFPDNAFVNREVEWAINELNRLSAGMQGQITFRFCKLGEQTDNDIVVWMVVNPNDPWFVKIDAAALALRNFRGNIITGGTILIRRNRSVDGFVIAHEAGHMYGFGHAPASAPQGIMGNRGQGFSYQELFAARMMLLRNAGNRFPDDDRLVQAISQSNIQQTVPVICDETHF